MADKVGPVPDYVHYLDKSAEKKEPAKEEKKETKSVEKKEVKKGRGKKGK